MTTLQNIKTLMKIEGNQQTIGSSSDKKALYSADYDLQEYILSKDKSIDKRNHILELFQNKFIKASRNSDIFIIDFKAGIDPKNNEPFRWNYDDIMRGYKQIDENDSKYFFTDIFSVINTIKLDVIAFIDNKFVEFSENYYFELDNWMTYKLYSKDENKIKLLLDVKKYVIKNNLYKALKRLLSYYKLENDTKHIILLQDFFNSEVGKLYKIISDLELIIILITETNISIVKLKVGIKNIDINTDKITKVKTRKAMKNKINKCVDKLRNVLDLSTRKFINENKFIHKYIGL